MLFEQIRFALAVAQMTDGAFDPTVGYALEQAGFNRHYLTGETIETLSSDPSVTYRDVVIDEDAMTVTLKRPAILDLGAVAKGFAVDLASRSLSGFDSYLVDAGGDVRVSGVQADSEPWQVGIRHPVEHDGLWCVLHIPEDACVCTSGSYVRRSPNDPSQHHIVHPVSKKSREDVLSCTVIARFAMMADALSTAAFVLGVEKGLELLEMCDVDGIFVTSDLNQYTTRGMRRYLYGETRER